MSVSIDWRRGRLVLTARVDGLKRSPGRALADAATRIDVAGGWSRQSAAGTSLRFGGRHVRSWTGQVTGGSVGAELVDGGLEVEVAGGMFPTVGNWTMIGFVAWVLGLPAWGAFALIPLGSVVVGMFIYIGLRAIARAATTGRIF